MELLSPAGNAEKLFYAYRYGADAAYIGIGEFSLRARAENIHASEYQQIKTIKGKKKLYGAVNIFFHDRDIQELERQLDALSHHPFDAFILTDVGIVKMMRKHFPHTPLHLSTQANCLNSEAAAFYRDLGFSRIVLARELSLKEIEVIRRQVPDVELEVFVHGAMCLAYSGRCLLSSWMTGRSANEGDCAHSCRWNYRVLEEENRKGEYYPIEEGEAYTTLLSSRDLCMIDHLKELRNAGVEAIKIEGRMKSLYYAAVVTRAYRKMMDNLDNPESVLAYREDVFRVSHREYSTGFYFGSEQMDSPTRKNYQREYLFLGTVGDAVSPGCYTLHVKNQIRFQDPIEFIGPDVPYREDRGYKLYDDQMQPALKADHGKEFFIIPSVPVESGFIMRKRI